MAFGPGDVVNNRYRILDKLGAGAHGVVYRARDLETREEVALKFLGDGKSLDPEYSRRIEREAMAMARLRGTSAVYVHGLNIAQGRQPVPGDGGLGRQRLRRLPAEAERVGGRLKKPKLLELLRPIVDTLEAAHQKGIVHRDLKPSNVFNRRCRARRRRALARLRPGEDAGRQRAHRGWHGGWHAQLHLARGLERHLSRSRPPDRCLLAGRAGVSRPRRADASAKGNVLDICSWAMKGARPSLHALRPSLRARSTSG